MYLYIPMSECLVFDEILHALSDEHHALAEIVKHLFTHSAEGSNQTESL